MEAGQTGSANEAYDDAGDVEPAHDAEWHTGFRVEAPGSKGVQAGRGNIQLNYAGARSGFDAMVPEAMGVQAGPGGAQLNVSLGAWAGAGIPGVQVSWPQQVGRPPRLAASFQPRRELVEQAEAELAEQKTALLTQVVASGNGGVGKTQLAASLFNRARDRGTDLRMWVTASSRNAVIAAYAQACAVVGAATRRDMAAEQAAEAFLDWLAATDRSWLMVLDDVANAADLNGLWPQGPTGAVLVTTRLRVLAASLAQAVPIAVETFTEAESAAYLTDRLASTPVNPLPDDVLDEAAELAQDLGHLPVALAQAGALIADEAITCREYRRRFADRTRALDRLLGSQPPDEYGHTVATTWTLAIDRADFMAPVGLARPALELAAVLDPNGAPEALWAAQPVLDWATSRVEETPRPVAGDVSPETGAGDAIDRPARQPGTGGMMRKALRNLHRLSLITHDPNAGPLAVRMHALVQRAVMDALDQEERGVLIRTAADAVLEAWPNPENDAGLSQSLRSNTATLADQGAETLWTPDAHQVLFMAGKSLGETGLVAQAVIYYTDLTETSIQELGVDHPSTLAARGSLARWRGEVGDPSGALEAFDDVLADCLRVLGPDHPDTLAARGSLARWRGEVGDPTGAVEGLEGVLADCLRVLGPDHPDTLTARHALAYWQGAAGNPADAVEAFEQMLADRLPVLGADHPSMLAARHESARWRGEAGDSAGAVEGLEEVLGDRLRVLGPDHPRTLAARHNLARWRGVAGDPSGAVGGLEELLVDCLRVLGADHPHTLTTRHDLARWRGEAGDPTGAVEGLEGVLADCLRVLGPDHPDTLAARHGLARWRGEAGDAAGAVEAFEYLLADRLRVLGGDHPHTLTTRHGLARWRGEAGDSAGAVEGLEEVLVDMLQMLGPDHRSTKATRDALQYWRQRADQAAAG